MVQGVYCDAGNAAGGECCHYADSVNLGELVIFFEGISKNYGWHLFKVFLLI